MDIRNICWYLVYMIPFIVIGAYFGQKVGKLENELAKYKSQATSDVVLSYGTNTCGVVVQFFVMGANGEWVPADRYKVSRALTTRLTP